MIDYGRVKDWKFPEVEHTYSQRDTRLYALGLGLGAEPLSSAHLAFVYEQGEEPLRAVPSMACVLALPGQWVRDPATGIDWIKLVHGEQRLEILRPLPAEGTVVGRTRVTSVVDKGEGRGALVHTERVVHDKASGAHLATVQEVRFCRGDGGYSAAGQPSDQAPPALKAVPDSPPDAVWQVATRRDMALIYRLSGDYNPLHADPKVARIAGYERPILHGLATYGLACRALLETCCEGRVERLRGLDARFTAPVLPGDSIAVHMWRVGTDVAFRAIATERGVVVLNHGNARLA